MILTPFIIYNLQFTSRINTILKFKQKNKSTLPYKFQSFPGVELKNSRRVLGNGNSRNKSFYLGFVYCAWSIGLMGFRFRFRKVEINVILVLLRNNMGN
jgi:hypothetical protein